MLAARCRRSAPIVPGLERTSGAREVTLKYQIELPTTGDESTKRNVARGKKFGAPGERPFYPRGQRRFKTRRAHSHISLQGCVVTLSTRYLTLLTCEASKLRWADRGTDISMRSSGDREKSAMVSYEGLRFPMRAVE